MALNTNKNVKLYYSIKEVAAMFDVRESTLRYWETEFPHLKPKTWARACANTPRRTLSRYAPYTIWWKCAASSCGGTQDAQQEPRRCGQEFGHTRYADFGARRTEGAETTTWLAGVVLSISPRIALCLTTNCPNHTNFGLGEWFVRFVKFVVLIRLSIVVLIKWASWWVGAGKYCDYGKKLLQTKNWF